MKFENLQKLFIHELKDLHDAENQILEALPKMIEKTSDNDLRSDLEKHLDETRKQVERLEDIFQEMGEDPGGQRCEGMAGLIEESEEVLKQDADPDVLDAGIIAQAQRIEHYEISGYGTAATYASTLENDRAGKLLRETLDEEKTADQKLNEVAKRAVNVKAKTGAD